MNYTRLGNSDLNVSRICMGFGDAANGQHSYLEEPCVPHPLAGVMAQNKPANAGERHVWTTGNQKI